MQQNGWVSNASQEVKEARIKAPSYLILFMTFWKRQNQMGGKQISGCRGPNERKVFEDKWVA